MPKHQHPKVLKRYVIRKYIMAASITDAIKHERNQSVDDVYLDDKLETTAIGFRTETD
jgi:hypothetical protein